MFRQRTVLGVLAVSALTWTLVCGCAGRRQKPAAERASQSPSPPTAVAAVPTSAPALPPQRATLERELEIASLELAKAKIAMELGQLKYRDAIALANTDFELAKKRLQVFERMTAPAQRARAELELQMAEDGLAEAQAEVYQLELKYGAEEKADQAREVEIERARHRLERVQRDLELRREEFKTLTEVLLPMEQQELEFAAEQRKRAALQAQRDDEIPALDRKIALLAAEAVVQRLEEEVKRLGAQPD